MMYKIVRHYQSGDRQEMDTGLTLDEAQAHCRREDTHDMSAPDPWFDAYTEE